LRTNTGFTAMARTNTGRTAILRTNTGFTAMVRRKTGRTKLGQTELVRTATVLKPLQDMVGPSFALASVVRFVGPSASALGIDSHLQPDRPGARCHAVRSRRPQRQPSAGGARFVPLYASGSSGPGGMETVTVCAKPAIHSHCTSGRVWPVASRIP